MAPGAAQAAPRRQQQAGDAQVGAVLHPEDPVEVQQLGLVALPEHAVEELEAVVHSAPREVLGGELAHAEERHGAGKVRLEQQPGQQLGSGEARREHAAREQPGERA